MIEDYIYTYEDLINDQYCDDSEYLEILQGIYSMEGEDEE